ncbi:hypothetical protein MKX01_023320 [Papaver californicum]|nr:hypothetical protein MKX01_023320 [Papaver californicum]
MIKFGAEWLHMDIMDGHFVPNLTIGAPVIESLRKHTTTYLDCHPMATSPLDYVEPLGKAGASGFTFHVEASKDNWQEIIEKVEAKNPVDMVLVMTVEPGFGGQKFIPKMMDNVRALRKKYIYLDIEVDGGLGPSDIDAAATHGLKSGKSLLIDDGALPWIVQNANNEASPIRRHIKLALCHLAQHEVNVKHMISGGALWELLNYDGHAIMMH